MTRPGVAVLLLLAVLLASCGSGGDEPAEDTSSAPTTEATEPSGSASSPEQSTNASEDAAPGEPRVVGTVANKLEAPWGLDFLPDGRAVVTERDTARVLVVTPPSNGAGPGDVTEVGRLPATVPQGEAGLLGVAVSPDFESDGLLYFYVCAADENRVVRAELDGDRLGETEVVLDGIPNGFIHDGGRLAFGPDGFLYVSTGEIGEAQLARERDGYAGKILRITADGEPAPDNPFGDAVWSWGHRNVQGLAFDDRDRLWASEFGDDRFDELNLIQPGDDYGWPEVEGKGGGPDFHDPALTWPTDRASPSGLAWLDGSLWMATLRGERLWRITVDGDRATDPTAFFSGRFGRLRTVVAAPDGRLWLTTSNRDGRGEPADKDDRILVVEPGG